MELAEDATSSGNAQAASDGVSGAAHLYCATICAIANVEINAASLKDEGRRTALLDDVAALRGRADQSVRESQTLFQLRLSS
jgi:formiminotetrahydrofolate cyclodeaminase